MSVDEQAAFAVRCDTTIGYLRKAISVGQLLAAKLCSDIEAESGGAVRRWDLHPEDWHRTWPELIGTPGAPKLPAKAKAAA